MNVFDDALSHDREPSPDPFALSGYASVAEHQPARMLGGSVYEVPPGKTMFPYHYEWGDEEWMLVVSGEPTLRTPAGRERLRPGDLRVFPAGPDGAHQCVNETAEPFRVLMISTLNQPRVIHYLDSDKIGVRTPGRAFSANFPRDAGVGYWDGEAS